MPLNCQSIWNCSKHVAAVLLLTLSMPFAELHAEENLPPQITYFGWMNPWSDYFIFYGTVVDEDPASCLVTFSGVMGDGYYASVNEYGEFYLVIELKENSQGGVNARCIDAELQQSEYAFTTVFY